jgi:hypothetical protein
LAVDSFARQAGKAQMTHASLGVPADTYDRPGYSECASPPGRRVVDAAVDVECVADVRADLASEGDSYGTSTQTLRNGRVQ